MKLLYTKYTLLCCTLMLLSACNFVDIVPPKDRITTSAVFEDETTATAAVLGLYGQLVTTSPPFSNGATTIFTGLASDELNYTRAIANQLEFSANTITSENFIVYNNFWKSAYQIIYQANACIEGLEASDLPIKIKNQLLGESHFIKAFCYWYLVHLFGDIPLVTTTNYETNAKLTRSAVRTVKDQILSDLLYARDLLVPEYPSEEKLRVNYYTVLALLSRYYLYEENWQEVERLSTEIIMSNTYECETDINNVFLATGTESIWQLATDQIFFNTIEGNRFIPPPAGTVKPSYTLTSELIGAFEPGDLRLSDWTASKTVADVVYTYPFKYKVSFNMVKSEHYVVFRLAEIYINRAEARAHLGKDTAALEDINILRLRANLSERTLSNTSDVLEAIRQEKRIEFFAEWGHRWFDLKRTSKIDEVLSNVKSHWESTDALFPIPYDEMIVNPNLEQNPGYHN